MGFPQNVKDRAYKDRCEPEIPLLDIHSREMKKITPTQKMVMNTYSNVIYNSSKVETMQMSINWWMIKTYVVWSHNGTLFSHKKEILIHATAEKNLENIMLSERRQTQKVSRTWFILYDMSRNHNSIETERRLVVLRRRGDSIWVLKSMGFFLGWWKCLRIAWWWWLHSLVNILKSTEFYTIK